jgi:hypothetical protein
VLSQIIEMRVNSKENAPIQKANGGTQKREPTSKL